MNKIICMRERFEKLDWVARILELGVYYHESMGYTASNDWCYEEAEWLGGAWFAYKQKHANFEEFMLSKGFKQSDLEVNNLTGEYKDDRAYWAFVAWGGK